MLMSHPNTLRACAIAGALALASAAGVLAQSFQINGRVKIEGGSLDDAKVVVYKNGEKQRTVNNGLSKFQLELDLNADYILSFEKEGFVTKKLSFNTHAPAEAVANGFTPFEFAVSMFKQYDDVNTVVFNQPVGMIRYSKEVDDFDYDTDYTKSIQSALEETMAKVAEKQKAEKDNETRAVREKEEADKAKARADADKAKADAEAAKLKAKQDKEAAEAAKKEQQRKDEEARKTEAAAKKVKPEPVAKAEPPPPPKKEKVETAPPPPVKAKPKAEPKPPPPPVRAVQANGVLKDPHEGTVPRRGNPANERTEESRVRPAKPNEGQDALPPPPPPKRSVERKKELIVEPNAVITRISLDDGRDKREYKKVVHKYGYTHYFKDGQSCSKLTYDTEALAETR